MKKNKILNILALCLVGGFFSVQGAVDPMAAEFKPLSPEMCSMRIVRPDTLYPESVFIDRLAAKNSCEMITRMVCHIAGLSHSEDGEFYQRNGMVILRQTGQFEAYGPHVAVLENLLEGVGGLDIGGHDNYGIIESYIKRAGLTFPSSFSPSRDPIRLYLRYHGKLPSKGLCFDYEMHQYSDYDKFRKKI